MKGGILLKKYFTVIPLQEPLSLTSSVYECGDNISLKNDLETSFPILIPIYNDVMEGEKISVVQINIDDGPNLIENAAKFKLELEQIQQKKKFDFEIRTIDINFTETIDNQINLFTEILNSVNENDEITADITYGTKAIPIIMINALECISKTIKNTSINRIVYGLKNFKTHEKQIFDVSALFFLNSALDSLIKANIPINKELIKSMLEMGGD